MKYIHKDRYSILIFLFIFGVIGTVGSVGAFFKKEKFEIWMLVPLILVSYSLFKIFTSKGRAPRILNKENAPTQLLIKTENIDGFSSFDLVGSKIDTIDGVCIAGQRFKLVDGGDYYFEDGTLKIAGFGTSLVNKIQGGFKEPKIIQTLSE